MSTAKSAEKIRTVCRRIQEVRDHSGLTVWELEQFTGLSRGFWQRLVAGRFCPSVKSIRCVALSFGVDLSWLMSGVGPAPDWDLVQQFARRMVTPRQNLVREVASVYGQGRGTASVMGYQNEPLPVPIPRNLEDAIGQVARLTGIEVNEVRATIGDMIRRHGQGGQNG